MSTPAFFTNFDCENSLKWPKLVDKLEEGMMRYSTGGVIVPVRAMLRVEDFNGYLGMMPCYSGSENITACKIISLYEGNKELNLPTIIVHVLLFQDGKLISIMEGESVTKRRTAATSALSARHLSRSEPPRKLAVLGAGLQALSHIQVLLNMFPSIEEITIWNHRKISACKLAEQSSGWLADKTLKVCDEVVDAVDNADLIVTATFASTPIVMSANVKLGAHIMAVGACVPSMAELDPHLMVNSQVFVDSYAGAKAESGDIIQSGCNIEAELGEVIANQKPGRRGEDAVTVYKSLGLAVQDLVAAKMVFDEAGGVSTNQPPFRIFSEEDARVHADDLGYYPDREVFSPDTVVSGLTGGGVAMECRASNYGSKFLTCCIKTEQVDESGRYDLCLVYKASTGQLLGAIEGRMVNQLDEEGKQTLFDRMFDI